MFTRLTNYIKCKLCPQIPTSSMSLEQFVEENLVQIMHGIKNAQDKIVRQPLSADDEKHFTPYIAPSAFSSGRKNELHTVSFDIATTVSMETLKVDSSNDRLHVKAKLVVVSGEVILNDKKTETKNNSHSSTSRIQFSIPVVYPTMLVPHPESEK